MNIRTFLRRYDFYHKLSSLYYKYLYDNFLKLLTVISPELNTKVLYYKATGSRINFKEPTNFKEKLLTLKVKKYNHSELVKKCADKFAVRSYILDIFGQQTDLLIPLLASYDCVEDINWDLLPNKFVIKWNFGCGFNIVCKDKTSLDIQEAKRKLRLWYNDTSYLIHAELQYKNVRKKILIEQFLNSSDGYLPSDYKVYCFNGQPKCVLYISGRDTRDESAAFYDLSWKYIGRPNKSCYQESVKLVDKPCCLAEMIACAQKLSDSFDFVRVDFYVVDGHLYFGEMTFTPAAGLDTSECLIDGLTMGDILKIS